MRGQNLKGDGDYSMRSGVVLFPGDRKIDNSGLAYRVSKAAKILGLSLNEFMRLVKEEEIPYVYHGHHRYYLRQDLEAFWDQKEKQRGIAASG